MLIWCLFAMNDIDGNYLKILNGIDRAVTHGEEGCPGERKTIFDIHLLSFQASKPVKSSSKTPSTPREFRKEDFIENYFWMKFRHGF